jgi:hypothetical protein
MSDHYMLQRNPDVPISFSNFKEVLQHSARTEPIPNAPGQTGRVVDLAVLLPGDMTRKGQSTDGQLVPELIPPLRQLCGHLGLELNPSTLIAWEGDRQFLESTRKGYLQDRSFLESYHDDDLKYYFPGLDRQAALDALTSHHEDLLRRATTTLQTCNLLLVGSPKGNPVMADLCDHLSATSSPQEIGFVLHTLAHEAALVLRRYRRTPPAGGDVGDKWVIDEWRESRWEDKDVGWLHMLRNPWATSPRFLIYLGGFYAQGTPAAMRKLIRIWSRLAAEPGRDIGSWLNEKFDAPWVTTPLTPAPAMPLARYIPAHVVQAEVSLPWVWFVKTPRLRRKVPRPRFLTPPAYQGTIHLLKGDPDTLRDGHLPDPAAYANPYVAGSYTFPEEIGGEALSFTRLGELFGTCAERGELRLAVLLPDNLVAHGQSTDVQLLPELVNALHQLCERQRLVLRLLTRLSWECDDRLLNEFPAKEAVFQDKLKEADCRLLFPGLEPDAAYLGMQDNQQRLLNEARGILGDYNLIVVGSPKVNRVMRNLCDVLAKNYDVLGRIGMYIHPDDREQPLQLRRFQGEHPQNPWVGRWLSWRERQWKHIHVGWLHLIRNPWARGTRRFLIYLGGIHAQGTPAAMRRLIDILTQQGQPGAQLDHHAGNGTVLPAHVVEARIDIPWGWFLRTPRLGLLDKTLWSLTPPSYDGSIRAHADADLNQADED